MTHKPLHPHLTRLASLAAVAMLAAACTSNAHPATRTARATSASHDAFLAEINRICGRAVAAHAGHDFPIAAFDPEHPEPSQLPTVGDFFDRYGGLPQTVTAFHALTPPPSDTATWQQLLSVADQIRANAQRQITAARAKDVNTLVTTVHTSQQLIDELNNDGARFGFTPTSACGQVFG